MPLKVKLVALLPRTPLENLLYIRYEYVIHAIIENNIFSSKPGCLSIETNGAPLSNDNVSKINPKIIKKLRNTIY